MLDTFINYRGCMVRAWRGRFSSYVDLGLWNHDTVVVGFMTAPITLGTESPGLRIGPNEAQQLMDDLWTCGLRPTEAAGSAGAMAATQEHLKDLRRMLFEDDRTKSASYAACNVRPTS